MNQFVLGAVAALVFLGIGLFWLEGRAEVERGAPPPLPLVAEPADDVLPQADPGDMTGPEPPEATELTREQRRFFRYDRNRDLKITREEMLSTRTSGFRQLDKDGNNLLTFEEWAVTTAERFDAADADGNRELTPAEFATTAPERKSKREPKCEC